MPKLQSVVYKLDNVYPSTYYKTMPATPTLILPASTKNRELKYIGYHENFLQNSMSGLPTGAMTNVQASVIPLYVMPDGMQGMFFNNGLEIYKSPLNIPVHQYVANAKTYDGHNHTELVSIPIPAGNILLGFRVSMQTGTATPDASAFFGTFTYIESD